MVDVLASGGATSGSVGRMGHGIGLHNTEWPSLMASDQTILQEGMILAIEPGYDFAQGKMMLHEENVVVRADRAELITRRAPRNIPIL
jgi:Xaa-Pro aminopeptidase